MSQPAAVQTTKEDLLIADDSINARSDRSHSEENDG